MLDQSSSHLLVLLNDVLDVAKIDHGQLQLEKAEVFLDAEVEHVMSIVRPTIRDRDILLHAEVTEAVPRCVCGCGQPPLLPSSVHLCFIPIPDKQRAHPDFVGVHTARSTSINYISPVAAG